MSNKKIFLIIILIVGIITGYFYWHSIRPSRIKSFCNHQAMENRKGYNTKAQTENYEFLYQECLRSKGL